MCWIHCTHTSSARPRARRAEEETPDERGLRIGAIADNISLYYTEKGRRITLKYVNAPVAKKTWHTLRVDFAGTRVAVSLDGKQYIEYVDSHITGAGAVGVWTKADSVTAFDDFSYGASGP